MKKKEDQNYFFRLFDKQENHATISQGFNYNDEEKKGKIKIY
jgi:hypothetical protein